MIDAPENVGDARKREYREKHMRLTTLRCRVCGRIVKKVWLSKLDSDHGKLTAVHGGCYADHPRAR